MSSPAYILEEVTFDTLRLMARTEVFVAQDGDPVRPLRETHVIIRDTTTDREVDSGKGEQNILKPGLIITYLGADFPAQAGQNCSDDGRHEILIQLVDDVATKNTQRRKSYHYWMNQIRKKLQANPYRATIEPCVADISMIQARQIGAADAKSYRLHNHFRAGLSVTAYVREPRT